MKSKLTKHEVQELAWEVGFDLNDSELCHYVNAVNDSLPSFQLVAQEVAVTPVSDYHRETGSYPDPADNPYNAWAYKARVTGKKTGLLSGKTVAVKDNISVAGIPMRNGVAQAGAFVPEIDATVVKYVLDAGATIVGKANNEYLCLSGGSHTCGTGPILNPHNTKYSAGGSSSGSAVLVANGDVDMALGGDQGGSIRIPASFCGIYGLKPTYGLVPYTGAIPIEMTIDTLGPMTATVEDNAKLLEAIAGEDGLDPRQSSVVPIAYSQHLDADIRSFKIAILKEGFNLKNSSAVVDIKVQHAANVFHRLGCVVDQVSIADHARGLPIWQAVALEGFLNTMTQGHDYGHTWYDLCSASLVDKYRHWHKYANDFSPPLKASLITAHYIQQKYCGAMYMKAQRQRVQLRRAYDKVLNDYDILLLPTTPMEATLLPGDDISDNIQRATEMLDNTAPFNVTGHPALNVPCGMSKDLPVGMMLVGRHFEEACLYQAAFQFEQAVNWKNI